LDLLKTIYIILLLEGLVVHPEFFAVRWWTAIDFLPRAGGIVGFVATAKAVIKS
jgi:hypothetical protein